MVGEADLPRRRKLPPSWSSSVGDRTLRDRMSFPRKAACGSPADHAACQAVHQAPRQDLAYLRGRLNLRIF